MKEVTLHYIWQYKCFNNMNLISHNGLCIKIIHPGYLNPNAGPDFLDARIKIDNTLWAGNIEIHVNQSDWKKHKHQNDKKYENIILHVCYFLDSQIPELDKIAPTLVLNGIVKPSFLEKYRILNENKLWIPCQSILQEEVLKREIPLYAYSLIVERLQRKNEVFTLLHNENKKDWEATAYQLVARSFGSKVNTFGFELLAKATPYKILMKHANNTFQLEAILLGQAALIPSSSKDDYVKQLEDEYKFLKKKYKLNPIKKEVWNYSKLRPYSFPDIKIAQWANFIHQFPKIFSYFLSLEKADIFLKKIEIRASNFWNTHYRIDRKSNHLKIKRLGKPYLNNLLINTLVPLVFMYGNENSNSKYIEQALSLLEQIPSERNSIVKNWKNLAYSANNALETQALLELKNEYCSKFACLKCRIGMKLLNS